ncbi:signal recognition particle, SRP19 subunit [Xylariaceae sp. FL1651]|nr:signal recognition particle, SRP19 subunit [Xylariaceae sp. FL1651]
MSHPRIEEVSDSDDEVSDPSEGDIDDFAETDILRAIPSRPAPSSSSSARQQPAAAPPPRGPAQHQHQHQQQAPQPGLQPSDIKDYQMLYPVYFDARRTRAEGRRVPARLAVQNPLAREIANACAALRLSPVFEAHRTHPKDWANPGRVRVALKAARERSHPVKNKHHLYVVVARYLQEHPTREDAAGSALRQGIRGGMGLGSLGGAGDVYADGKPWPRPAVPRGWKMGDLLPAYSAAMTGGGVSENAFKDMMREMQGQGGGAGMGMPGMNADMMSMLQGMGGMGGGGGGGPAAVGGSEGGGKKNKKGKGK